MLSESFLLSVRDILLENDHTNELHNKLLQHGFKLNPGTDNMYSHPNHPNSTIGLMSNTTHERLQRHFDKFGIKPEHNANSSEHDGKSNALHHQLTRAGYHHEGNGHYTLAGADDIHINNSHTQDQVKGMVDSGHEQVRSKIKKHIEQHAKKLGISNPQMWIVNNAVIYPDPHDGIRNDYDGLGNNSYDIKPHKGFNARDIEHAMNSHYVKHSGMSPTEDNARKIIATKQYLDSKGFSGGTKGIYSKKGVVGRIDSTKGLEYVEGQIESHEEFNKNFAIHHNGDVIQLEHQRKVGNIYDEKILNNDVKSNLMNFNATIENHNKVADSLGISPKLLLGHDKTDIMDNNVTIPSKDNLAKKGLHIVHQNENSTIVYHENSPHVKHTIEHNPPKTRSIFTNNPFHNVDTQINDISRRLENNYKEPSTSDITNANATRQSIKSSLSGMGINLNISSNANRVEDGLKNAHQSAINTNHPKVIASLAANKDVSIETLHNLSKHPMLNYDAINNIIDNPNTNRDILKILMNHPNVTMEHKKKIVNHPKTVE